MPLVARRSSLDQRAGVCRCSGRGEFSGSPGDRRLRRRWSPARSHGACSEAACASPPCGCDGRAADQPIENIDADLGISNPLAQAGQPGCRPPQRRGEELVELRRRNRTLEAEIGDSQARGSAWEIFRPNAPPGGPLTCPPAGSPSRHPARSVGVGVGLLGLTRTCVHGLRPR